MSLQIISHPSCACLRRAPTVQHRCRALGAAPTGECARSAARLVQVLDGGAPPLPNNFAVARAITPSALRAKGRAPLSRHDNDRRTADHDDNSIAPNDIIRLAILDVGVAQRSIRVAPRVERLGYGRYWISEHHGEGSITNPTLLVAAIGAVTTTRRIGTAGVLLEFQSALSVAENFRTVAELFPGRIDVGLARARANPVLSLALADGRPDD